MYVAGAQLLFSAPRSSIPASLCGVLAGIAYHSNIFGMKRLQVGLALFQSLFKPCTRRGRSCLKRMLTSGIRALSDRCTDATARLPMVVAHLQFAPVQLPQVAADFLGRTLGPLLGTRQQRVIVPGATAQQQVAAQQQQQQQQQQLQQRRRGGGSGPNGRQPQVRFQHAAELSCERAKALPRVQRRGFEHVCRNESGRGPVHCLLHNVGRDAVMIDKTLNSAMRRWTRCPEVRSKI